ncbi:hypothetical protein GOEFS_018_00510 [Gordonia effusa NBRC 100432]|uniref:Glycosyltransferase RgtA/B/C/D-like domain-containing protein n=1 Tax=Gordonia effusa NBRC 100432 TaxID=1077974 RepID=H0QW18_9ACTN|nr:hypothetical protein GOEFS_018_00510 [Gordonia effusa NBRC 100432]
MFTAWLVSAVATFAIMAPLWRPGYLLYRDAVSTPRTFLTDSTLGIGGNPPRAVPQDGLIALLSSVVNGGTVVVAILTLSLLLAGVGYGLLAGRVVRGAGATGVAAASIIALWNPFVAERLLQGHWSLFTSYAALGWILLSALRIKESWDSDVRPAGKWHNWAILFLATLVAALTPSGWLIGSVVVLAALSIPLLIRRRCIAAMLSAAPIVIGSLPLLVSAAVGTSVTTAPAISVSTFALRAEPGLGRLLTAVSLGGIWNADAEPSSRQSGWATVAALLFTAVVAVGIWWLWHTRNALDSSARSVIVTALALAGGALTVIVCVSAGPGMSALKWLTESVAGAGLLRDTTKFAIFAIPLIALAAAGFVDALKRWVPAGFAIATVLVLVVAPLPDLVWGVGGAITPVRYPDEWRAVADRISADEGAIALWPGDTVRRFDFTDGPSLDPTARMVRATVAESGELRVDGVVIDPGSAWATDVHRMLASGGDLGSLGIGWVLASAPVPSLSNEVPVFRGPTLTLYRISNPHNDFAASTTSRGAALTALGGWIGAIIASVVALVGAAIRRRLAPRPR